MYGFEVEGGCVFYKFRDMDGSYSLTDEHLQWFWEIMKKGGQISTVFYDGSIDSFPQFLALAKMKDQHFFLGFKDDVPAILFWVNGLASRSCYVHFCKRKGFRIYSSIKRQILLFYS